MNVLEINAVYHKSSAALLVDGKVVAACEEERFNRSQACQAGARRQPARASRAGDTLLSGSCGT